MMSSRKNPRLPTVILTSALLVLALAGLSLQAPTAHAEDDPATSVPVDPAAAGALPSPVAQVDTSAGDKYSEAELKEIVGPIALYPDIVISSLLPASTEPIDVVRGARWVKAQGGEVKEIPEDMTLADSVQALVQFPDVLQWMSENLEWLEQLGYAVTNQNEDVLTAIQKFRKESKDAGNLESNEQQQVIENNNVIEVQPADPEVVYIPTYDPVYVTQPVATPVYGAYVHPLVSFGVGFAVGAVGAWAWHSIGWGGGWRGGGSININNSPTYNFNKGGNINR
ncbi:MAG: DUF3300 domain-containing protein, partial [Planctomycetota bacterium]|nr:DUF3300 domain-containing protein [Planctomycetota bacterium]